MLKAKKPELIKEGKPKLLISGKAGVGKTYFALDFPAVYYIDVEGGATREQYRKKLIESGALYMGIEEGSQDFQSVIQEIKTLGTTKTDRKTLIIDSFSKLYNLEAAIAEERIGNDFGRDRKEANRPSRQLLRWISSLDMTVLLICHYKDKWGRKNGEIAYEGSTFDGYDKYEYDLDLWIEAFEQNGKRFFTVKKTRIEPLKLGAVHPLNYADFANLYGKDTIEAESKPAEMAEPIQIARLATLVKTLNLPLETIEGWLRKAGIDGSDLTGDKLQHCFAEFTSPQIQKCITILEKELKSLGGTK